MDRDRLVDDLALDALRAVAEHQECGDLLLRVDVLRRALAFAEAEVARVSRTLPPPELEDALREKVVYGLENRVAAELLRDELDERTRAEMEEPPGGRDAWPDLWPGDRRRDRHRLHGWTAFVT